MTETDVTQNSDRTGEQCRVKSPAFSDNAMSGKGIVGTSSLRPRLLDSWHLSRFLKNHPFRSKFRLTPSCHLIIHDKVDSNYTATSRRLPTRSLTAVISCNSEAGISNLQRTTSGHKLLN